MNTEETNKRGPKTARRDGPEFDAAPVPGETLTEAHEWECRTCQYVMRLEIGPLCCEGGICNKCGGEVEYHGIKRGIPKSSLGVKKAQNGGLSDGRQAP